MQEPTVKINVRNVSKHFEANGNLFPVLQEVDLEVYPSEFVTIIGPSGCGKTTLLNIIAGLDQPDIGSIEVDGSNTENKLGLVGYMHQKDLLMPWRTALDNAILSLEIQGMGRRDARATAAQHLEVFGLDGFEKDYPAMLSGGMRQRVSFLRTVLTGKDVILLDEPFGALDALTRTQMQEWLIGLWAALRKTIILVTHDVEEAVLLSDRVFVLTSRPGRIKLVREIDLPRPRSYRMVTASQFTKIKSEILESLLMASEPIGDQGTNEGLNA